MCKISIEPGITHVPQIFTCLSPIPGGLTLIEQAQTHAEWAVSCVLAEIQSVEDSQGISSKGSTIMIDSILKPNFFFKVQT